MNSFLAQVDPRITEAEVTLSGTTITVVGPADGAPLLNPGRTGAAVTYTAVDTPTGPYHDSDTANYSGGALPVSANQVEDITFNLASTGGNLRLTVKKPDGSTVTSANAAWNAMDATYLAAINTQLDAITGVTGGIVATAIPATDTDLGIRLTYSGAGYAGKAWTPAVVQTFPTTSTVATYTPVTTGYGDTLYFRNGDNLTGPRYGTALSTVSLAAIIVERSYAGRIGLPDNRGSYQEFREKRLYTKAAILKIDNGNRGTIDRFRNGFTNAAVVSALSDNRVAALDIAGLTGSGSAVSLTNCGLNLGVDTVAGAGLTVDSITGSNVAVNVGPGYTAAALKLSGSTLEINGVVTNADLDGVLATVTGTLTNANVYNGSSIGWKTSTSPTALDVVNSVIDYSSATGSITAPTCNIGGTSAIVDPLGRLAEPWYVTLFEGSGAENVSIVTPKTGRRITIGV